MKKINNWLNKNIGPWEHPDNEGQIILWCALSALIVLFAGQFIFNSVALMFSLLCLGVTFVPPVIEGMRAIVKKDRFNPKNWFLCVQGLVLGGLFACLALFVIRGLITVITYIC